MTRGIHAVSGHEDLRASLARALRRGSLPPTLLLHGPRGAGKQRLALWLAQLALCESPGERGPCDACRSCRLALRVEHPDLHWYFPVARPGGAASPDKLAVALEEARSEALATFRDRPLRPSWSEEPRAIYLAAAQSLRRRAHRRPLEGTTQVFIVADAEALVPQESSPEAANALLKLLEEPPDGTRFVLTSSEPGELLPTIRSRTLPVHVAGLPAARVERFLVDAAGCDPGTAARAARLSHGSIGRALGFLPDEEGVPGPLDRIRTEGLELLEAALSRRSSEGLRRALAHRPWGGRGLLDLLDAVEEWLRDLAAVAADAGEWVLDFERMDRLHRLAAHLAPDPTSLSRAREAVEEARLHARGNVNPQLLVAGLVVGLRRALLDRARVGAAP